MAKVRLGFAGVGFMGQAAHLRNYVRNPDCEIVALAEPRQELARLVAKRYDIPKVYRSHLELADDPDVEAVVASQPYLMNGYIVLPLLRAGKSVFIEKPMAGCLAEAEELVEAARANKALLMVGFMKRYDTGVQLAKENLDVAYQTGSLGPVGLINANCFCGDWLRDVEPPITTDEPVPPTDGFVPRGLAWMTPAQQETFTAYMNIFSHNLNLIRYLFPGKLKVAASLLRNGMLNQSTLLESDGVLVNLYGIGVSAGWWEEKTEIYFRDGWMRIVTPSPMEQQAAARVEMYHGAKRQETKVVMGRPYWAFRAQADHFVECIRSRNQPRSSGEDSLEDMRLMEDVFRKAIWI